MRPLYTASLSGRWNTLLQPLPRWFNANLDFGQFDYVADPSIQTFAEPTSSFATPNPTILSNWIINSPVAITGSVWESLSESIANELEMFRHSYLSLWSTIGNNPDATDAGYAWTVEFDDEIVQLEVDTQDGWVDVKEFDGISQLLNAGEWGWYKEGSTVLMYGFGFVNKAPHQVSNWLFIPNDHTWAWSGPVYAKHPESGNYLSLHAADIRTDGWLGLYGAGSNLRYLYNNYQKTLEFINVRINGTIELVASISSTWNSVDEKGLIFDTPRTYLESDYSHRKRLENFSKLSIGYSRRYVAAQISARLGEGYCVTTDETIGLQADEIDAVSTQFPRIVTLGEKLIKDSSSPTRYYSRYAEPSAGHVYGGLYGSTYVRDASGSINIPSLPANYTGPVIGNWLFEMYTVEGTSVVMQDSTPSGENEFFIVKSVRANEEASSITKSIAFSESQLLYWTSYGPDEEATVPVLNGSSEFD